MVSQTLRYSSTTISNTRLANYHIVSLKIVDWPIRKIGPVSWENNQLTFEPKEKEKGNH